jgi:rubrerythrin
MRVGIYMPLYFSPYEIAILAMQIEEEGYIYYSKLFNLATDNETKSMFNLLVNQESKHKEFFKKLQ